MPTTQVSPRSSGNVPITAITLLCWGAIAVGSGCGRTGLPPGPTAGTTASWGAGGRTDGTGGMGGTVGTTAISGAGGRTGGIGGSGSGGCGIIGCVMPTGGSGDPCTDFTQPPTYLCGNGVLDPGEDCDDGNGSGGDGCSPLCQLEGHWLCPVAGQRCQRVATCGDGILTSDEVCDDGNNTDGDGCSADCQRIGIGWQCRAPGAKCTLVCGNRRVTGNKTCDDGNTQAGDGCAANCQVEPGYSCPVPGMMCVPLACGSGDAGRSCDTGAANPGFQPRCGDGIASVGEECDDGDDPTRDPHNDDAAYGGCTTQCKWGAYCGDSAVNGLEECDLGAGNGGREYGRIDGCTAGCRKTHYCGDSILDSDKGELCDLGDLNGKAIGPNWERSDCGRVLCLPNCTIPIW